MKSLKVGLTGPIGAGKSTVANVWRELGAGIVEGDAMGRLVLESDLDLRSKLVARFDSGIIDPIDGSVIRSELARLAFSNKDNQKDLTRITFPPLYRRANEELIKLMVNHSIIVFDAALIFEWGVESDFDKIVVVTGSVDRIVSRSTERLGISRSEAADRLSLQIDPLEKERRADLVILNNGSVEELQSSARKNWDNLIKWLNEQN